MTHDELTRLAFLYAEQDREGMARCWGMDSVEGKDAAKLAKRFRDHRMKRWGKTRLEEYVGNAVAKTVTEIQADLKNTKEVRDV